MARWRGTARPQGRWAPRWWSALLAVLVVAVGLASPAGAQLGPAAPAITATPSIDLVDRQVVTVEGSGWSPGASPAIVQCTDVTTGPASCDTARFQYVTADGDGNFSVGFTVRRLVMIGSELVDCADPGRCSIAAGIPPDGSAGNATTPIQFDPSVPLPPPPSVTVTPDTGLLQGQTVTVEGEGYEPGFAYVAQCLVGAGIEGCSRGPLTSVDVADDGTFTAQVVVRRLLTRPDGQVVDCAEPGVCSIGAGTPEPLNNASAPIQFDPNAPLPPPPSFVVDPSTGLEDGQVVTVSGVGYDPMVQVGVVQCAAEPPGLNGCDMRSLVFAAAAPDGSFSTSFEVKQVIQTAAGAVDCAVERCRIAGGPFGPTLGVDIAFATDDGGDGGGSGGGSGGGGTGRGGSSGAPLTPRFTG